MKAPAVVLFTVTETDGMTHLVTEDAMVAGRLSGCYVAVCDSPILAASLTTPERRSCRLCREWRTSR